MRKAPCRAGGCSRWRIPPPTFQGGRIGVTRPGPCAPVSTDSLLSYLASRWGFIHLILRLGYDPRCDHLRYNSATHDVRAYSSPVWPAAGTLGVEDDSGPMVSGNEQSEPDAVNATCSASRDPGLDGRLRFFVCSRWFMTSEREQLPSIGGEAIATRRARRQLHRR